MRKKIGGNKRMKRFRETGSMLKDPSKGSSLRRDLSQGASGLKSAFKKIKDAGKSLSRGTKDLSATRVIQSPKTKQLSSSTAKEDGNKLIQTGQAASKPKKALSPVMAGRQRSLEARRKRAAEKAKEKELAQARQTAAKSKEPKRRPNESITVFRQRLAKYRRENN